MTGGPPEADAGGVWVEGYVDFGDGKPTLVRGRVDRLEGGQVLQDLEVAPDEPRQ